MFIESFNQIVTNKKQGSYNDDENRYGDVIGYFKKEATLKILVIFFITDFLFLGLLCGQTCPYAFNNENPPENEPLIYGKALFSVDSVIGISFSPKGDELIFSVKPKGVYYMKKESGKWTTPQLMAFSKHSLTHIMYPKFSPDGKFISYVDGNSKQYGFGDIFMIKRQDDSTWSESIKLPEPLNSSYRDAGHCFTLDGNLYFTSGRADKTGNNDIFKATPQKNGETKIDLLSELSQFSVITDEECLYVSPNEEFLITDSWHQYSKHKHDLYISFKVDNDKWSPIKPLNSKINTDSFENQPFVTSDYQYLFFKRGMNINWVRTKEVFVPFQRLQIPDFYEKVNYAIKITFPKNVFGDFDGEITDYDISLRDTNKLPDWLKFDKEKLTLSGKPENAETLVFILRATDNDKNISETEFKIVIEK